jgi:hypothetical protein
MTAPLRPCPGCSRHVRASESACPFCRHELDIAFRSAPSSPTPAVGRLSRAALFAIGAGGLTAGSACGSLSQAMYGTVVIECEPDAASPDCLPHVRADASVVAVADGAGPTFSIPGPDVDVIADDFDGGGEVVGNPDGGGCVVLDPASFDTSCQVDSDCETIFAGTLCPGWECLCDENAAISLASASSYIQLFRSVPPTGLPCECPASTVIGSASCVAQECVLTRNSAEGSGSF